MSTELPPPETVVVTGAVDELDSNNRLMAMLSHLLALAGYLATLGQYAVPLVFYLIYKDSSKFVAFHSLQSLYFRLLMLILHLVGNSIIGLVTCGMGLFVSIPLFIIYEVVYTILIGIKANQGLWDEYPFVGAAAKKTVLQ